MADELKPLSAEKAVELGLNICHANKIKVSKAHLLRICKAKSKDKQQLRFFYSVQVRTGRGTGLMIINRNNDFGERLLRALEIMPPERRAGNVPVVHDKNLRPPLEG